MNGPCSAPHCAGCHDARSLSVRLPDRIREPTLAAPRRLPRPPGASASVPRQSRPLERRQRDVAPPPWVAALRVRGAALRARAAADPRAFRRNAIAAAVSLVGLFTAVQLWRHRPRAVRTAFGVTAPAATDLTVDTPKPKPLRVMFEASV